MEYDQDIINMNKWCVFGEEIGMHISKIEKRNSIEEDKKQLTMMDVM